MRSSKAWDLETRGVRPRTLRILWIRLRAVDFRLLSHFSSRLRTKDLGFRCFWLGMYHVGMAEEFLEV